MDLASGIADAPPLPVLVCTAAWFEDPTDPRIGTLIGAAALASALNVAFLVLNGSPLERLAQGLISTGAMVVPTQLPPAAVANGGSALRAALREGLSILNAGEEAVIAWIEPDQQDAVRWLPHLASLILNGPVDIVVPRRADAGGATAACGYPPDQLAAERFGNLYLNQLVAAWTAGAGAAGTAAAAAAAAAASGAVAPVSMGVDWFFGVLLVRASVAARWVQSDEHEPRTVALLLPFLEAGACDDSRFQPPACS
mgnify:CR=1 FL=1